MSQQPPSANQTPPHKTDAVAGLLSFAVPGLGQIYQGIRRADSMRLGKGVFFLVAIWGMFFTGQAMGAWQNVYLPQYQQAQAPDQKLEWFGWKLPDLLGNLYLRLPYVGQFWAGAAAWPAAWNYAFPDAALFGEYQKSPGAPTAADREGFHNGDLDGRKRLLEAAEAKMNKIQFEEGMGKYWDVGLIYTVIAGVLNILVIYDATAGPMYPRRPAAERTPGANPSSEEGAA